MNVTYTINKVSKRANTERRARKSVIYFRVTTNRDFAKPVAELFSGWRRNNPFRVTTTVSRSSRRRSPCWAFRPPPKCSEARKPVVLVDVRPWLRH